MHRFAFAPALLWLIGATDPPNVIEVEVQGVRNMKGVLHACITQDRSHFPDCRQDPAAIRQTVPAAARQLRFPTVVAGRYAVTLLHDENTNSRMDTLLGIPREGFGFSRNPVIRFGAPRFDTVGIDVGSGFTRVKIRMQYML